MSQGVGVLLQKVGDEPCKTEKFLESGRFWSGVSDTIQHQAQPVQAQNWAQIYPVSVPELVGHSQGLEIGLQQSTKGS